LVKIQDFEISKHYEVLLELHKRQKSDTFSYLSPETTPKIGFLATFNDSPATIGFLRMVEGGYCQIDTMVSNPELPSNVRHESMTLTVNSLISKAKEMKLRGIIIYSIDESMLCRAEAIGFKSLPHEVMALPLKDV